MTHICKYTVYLGEQRRTRRPPMKPGSMIGMARAATVRKKPRRYAHSEDNGRVVLTCIVRREEMRACVPTPDPHDRAHLAMDATGYLLPAFDVPSARPRRYPQSQLTSRGVPFDSAYDDWAKNAKELTVAGINVGLGATRFIGASADAREALAKSMGGARQLRDRLEPQTTQSDMTAQELALERRASAMLARHGGM